jgi:hypothetical protein
MWLSRMTEPASSARSAEAASIWPLWPRSVWISGWKGAEEPMAASVDSAPGHERGLRGTMSAEEAGQRQGGRDLRAVDEGEALLGGEHDGREAGARKGRRTGHALAGIKGLAFADHHRRHVRERREVAGGADGTLFRDHRHARPCACMASSSATISSARPRRRGRARSASAP